MLATNRCVKSAGCNHEHPRYLLEETTRLAISILAFYSHIKCYLSSISWAKLMGKHSHKQKKLEQTWQWNMMQHVVYHMLEASQMQFAADPAIAAWAEADRQRTTPSKLWRNNCSRNWKHKDGLKPDKHIGTAFPAHGSNPVSSFYSTVATCPSQHVATKTFSSGYSCNQKSSVLITARGLIERQGHQNSSVSGVARKNSQLHWRQRPTWMIWEGSWLNQSTIYWVFWVVSTPAW